MGKKSIVVCEVCGGVRPSAAADFVVFHCLTFCSADCLDDYRASDEERRAKKEGARISKPMVRRPRAA